VRSLISEIGERLDGLAISAMARTVKRERLTYLSNRKLRRLEKILGTLASEGVQGSYLEFGVAMGGSAILIAAAARDARQPFVGFDVFGMIPPPESEKDDERSKKRYETIAAGKSKGINGDEYYGYRKDLYGDVVREFSGHGIEVDGTSVSLVKGLFEDTWPTRGIGAVAFAHIDCDWYDPVKFCVKETAALLAPAGIILLDDYRDYGGCRVATDEFLGGHPEFELEDGANAILRRRRT
jgi:O-methyltransferase